MITVLDTSAAIEILLSREHSENLREYILKSRKVISSDLYKVETANVLWKYVKSGFIKRDQVNELLSLVQDLVDEYIDISENNEESMNEAIRLNHSVYDMLYFTLARRTGATLLTMDKKLKDLAVSAGLSTN
ncbi:MAG TPA: type II toxin-antitoxin system VapC family toxin [Spirochaetota bacterium]|nr:type II toxin-antitoxin system VapC family toxin [Spirochaetota bacterium]HPF05817.1 type II toxin-antitoxin system VapC family toxin [Spirochaetota bacterium]HRX47270.1 type II toxin-antitoxin system VapC family toxin [Spirochaetota bacterium]